MDEAPRLSVIIPVYNGERYLPLCLTALAQSQGVPLRETIVVNDGSTDGSAAIASSYGSTLISTGSQRGPAYARNLGAQTALAPVLVFLDADVCVHPDTLAHLLDSLHGSQAVFGSYDDTPSVKGIVSQYRNLLHCFTHRTGPRKSATFWAGCGAICSETFRASGGFDPSYKRPSIEDIELGYRLRAAGVEIRLDPKIQVTHMKHWTLRNMIETDVRARAIPWARLMLRRRKLQGDLSLGWTQRLSVALVCCAPLLAPASPTLAAAALATVIVLNLSFYRFLNCKRGLPFALACIPLHLFYFFYSGLALAWVLLTEPLIFSKRSR